MLIVGNERTSRETILREVQLKSGQPLSQQQEDETRTRITSLGLFRRVDISYLQLPGEQNHRDVVITVEEAPVTTIGYGGGLEGGKRLVRSSRPRDAVEEFQFAPRGFFQMGRRNLFGKDRSLDLFTRVSFRPEGRQRVAVRIHAVATTTADTASTNIWRGSPMASGAFSAPMPMSRSAAASSRHSDRASISTAAARSVTLTRRISRTLAVSGRYGIDHTTLLNIKSNFAAQPEIDRLFPQVRLSSVASSLIRDTRNDSIEPNQRQPDRRRRRAGGAAHRIAGRVLQDVRAGIHLSAAAAAELGRRRCSARASVWRRDFRASCRQRRAATDHRRRSAGERAVLCRRRHDRSRLHARSTRHAGDDRSGRLSDGRPRTDRAERGARVPLRGGLGAVAFIDGGNVWRDVDDMDLTQMRGAVGFGLRYRSPVGPIRVDLGIKMDRRMLPTGERERPTALHISLGQAF